MSFFFCFRIMFWERSYKGFCFFHVASWDCNDMGRLTHIDALKHAVFDVFACFLGCDFSQQPGWSIQVIWKPMKILKEWRNRSHIDLPSENMARVPATSLPPTCQPSRYFRFDLRPLEVTNFRSPHRSPPLTNLANIWEYPPRIGVRFHPTGGWFFQMYQALYGFMRLSVDWSPPEKTRTVEMYDFTGLNSRCSDDLTSARYDKKTSDRKESEQWLGTVTSTGGIKWFDLCFPFLNRMRWKEIPWTQGTMSIECFFSHRMPNVVNVALSLQSVKVDYVSPWNSTSLPFYLERRWTKRYVYKSFPITYRYYLLTVIYILSKFKMEPENSILDVDIPSWSDSILNLLESYIFPN